MTVSTELSHEEYTGNGVTTDFDFRFRIFEAKHLVVSVADPDGTERILTNGTDYTLRGVGSYRGGKVILKMPLATGWKIGIARDLPAVQETDLRNQGKFFAEVHEDAFDYLTMLIQKSLGYLSLCLRKPSFISDHYDAKGNKISNLGKPVKDGDAIDLGTMKEHISAKDKRSLRVADKDIPVLPNAVNRANKLLSFDNDGNPVVIIPESGSAADVLVELGKPEGALLIGTNSSKNLQEKITDIDAVSSGIDLSDLGYDYSSGNDAAPYLDDFLSKYNGTGATVIISEDCMINTPAWLNAIPKNVNVISANGAIITSRMTGDTNYENHYAIINLRGERSGKTTTVTEDISEGQSYIVVDDSSEINPGSYIEIDLRSSAISTSTLSTNASCPCRVISKDGNRIFIDYAFPFPIKFSSTAKRVVYIGVDCAENCNVDINYKDETSITGAQCYGVHAFHAVWCGVTISCDDIVGNGVMHTYTAYCNTNGYGRNARDISPGLGYLCKVSASRNHSFDYLHGVNLRHTLDYSSASYCYGKIITDSGSFSGFTTHGIGENNIHIEKIISSSMSTAEAGAEFGYYNKNITFDEVVCDEQFTCGYVENLTIRSGNIARMEIRRGGTYDVCATIDEIAFNGRNGRTGVASHQGITIRDSEIGKYDVTRADYFHTENCTLVKDNISSSFHSVEIKHLNLKNSGHRERISGTLQRYVWHGGVFNDESSYSNQPIVTTARMEGGSTYFNISNCDFNGKGPSGMALIYVTKFNETALTNITVNICNNRFVNMGTDSGAVDSNYNIRKIIYSSNVRDSSPAFSAAYVINTDITI